MPRKYRKPHSIYTYPHLTTLLTGDRRPRYGYQGARPQVIYGLVDPRDGCVRYIGVTANPWKRWGHYRKQRGSNDMVTRWLEHLGRLGLAPQWVVLDVAAPWRRESAEGRWIAWGRRCGKLWNVLNGGEPPERLPSEILRDCDPKRRGEKKRPPPKRKRYSWDGVVRMGWRDPKTGRFHSDIPARGQPWHSQCVKLLRKQQLRDREHAR